MKADKKKHIKWGLIIYACIVAVWVIATQLLHIKIQFFYCMLILALGTFGKELYDGVSGKGKFDALDWFAGIAIPLVIHLILKWVVL